MIGVQPSKILIQSKWVAKSAEGDRKLQFFQVRQIGKCRRNGARKLVILQSPNDFSVNPTVIMRNLNVCYRLTRRLRFPIEEGIVPLIFLLNEKYLRIPISLSSEYYSFTSNYLQIFKIDTVSNWWGNRSRQLIASKITIHFSVDDSAVLDQTGSLQDL